MALKYEAGIWEQYIEDEDGTPRDTSGYTDANARLYCYTTRAQARDGNVGDDVGQRGRIA